MPHHLLSIFIKDKKIVEITKCYSDLNKEDKLFTINKIEKYIKLEKKLLL